MASDGDDAGSAGTAGGNQTTTGSNGSAQVGSAGVSAPVRVLSDGDGASSSGSGGGGQVASGSNGSAQIGSPSLDAPIRVISAGDDAGAFVGRGAQGEPVAPVEGESSPGTGGQGGPVSVAESVPGSGPGTDTLEDGSSPSAALRPVSAVLGVSAESLPLTGLGVAALFLTGLMLLSTGAVLRRGSVATG